MTISTPTATAPATITTKTIATPAIPVMQSVRSIFGWFGGLVLALLMLTSVACSSVDPAAIETTLAPTVVEANDDSQDQSAEADNTPAPIPTAPTTSTAPDADPASTTSPTPAPTNPPAPTSPPAPTAPPAPPAPTNPTPTSPPAPTTPPAPTAPPQPNQLPSIDDVVVEGAQRTVTLHVVASDIDGDPLDISVVWPDGVTETLPGSTVSFTHRFTTDVYAGQATVFARDAQDVSPGQVVEITAVRENTITVSGVWLTADPSCFALDDVGNATFRELSGTAVVAGDTSGYSDAVQTGSTPAAVQMGFGSREFMLAPGFVMTSSRSLAATVNVTIDAALTGVDLGEDIAIVIDQTFGRTASIDETFASTTSDCSVRITATVDYSHDIVGQAPITGDIPTLELGE